MLYTFSSFKLLIKSGAKKLIAKNGDYIRCMILYLAVNDENHILCQCGDTRKLRSRLQKEDFIQTSWKLCEDQEKTFVRLFYSKRVKNCSELYNELESIGLTWNIVLDGGFLKSEICICNVLICQMIFCKCLFQGQSSLVLCRLLGDGIETSVLVKVAFVVTLNLHEEVLLICDDVLDGCELLCHDYCEINRTKQSNCFFP